MDDTTPPHPTLLGPFKVLSLYFSRGKELGLRVKERSRGNRGSQAPPEHHPAGEGQAGPTLPLGEKK